MKVEIEKLNGEIKRKNEQVALLEKQIAVSVISSRDKMDKLEASRVCAPSFAYANCI